MKAAFVADAHVGNHKLHGGYVRAGINDRCVATLLVLREAIAHGEEYCVDVFVHLGDLFDTARPSPQVIRATQDILYVHQDARERRALLLGNHERVSDALLDHALGPLEVEGVHVYGRSGVCRVGNEFLAMVPFQDGHATDWLEGEVDLALTGTSGECVGLCLHLGIYDASDTEPWIKEAQDAVPVELLVDICERYGIPRVYAGNWHCHRKWTFPSGVEVTQLGALVPTGWDNPGVSGYGTVEFLGCRDKRTVIPGPRFIEVTSQHEAARAVAEAGDNMLYIRAKVPPGDLTQARAQLTEAVGDADCVAALEILVDQKVAAESARAAARAARSTTTMADAVDAYFSKLKLDADKSRVQALVMRYLGLEGG